ncbi:ClpP/crotonase-like domain-containing protein [Lentinula boryana]|uniref:ClpP/crotonase-like domain-containing protein n=1 Tax=Lentinula boryana TaxID=40481 RepID=A0ABQ8QF76_9AGAR|nr:ClpP/crotonase-like domain-containing protein [Lentinula boryana]
MTSYPLSLPAENPLITLTHPKKSLWIIELHNGDDSRLTHELINQGLKPALNTVEKEWRESWRIHIKDKKANKEEGKGALIIVGRRDQDKFFSNGLDFVNSQKDPNFFQLTFDPLIERILTFPIPTIAAINGHCFAGAFMLSMACDYRVMTDGSSRRAWLSMNEVHFGAPWPTSFAALVRSKFGTDPLKRKLALEGHRFTPQEGLEVGIVDVVVNGNTAAVLARAEQLGDQWSLNAQGGVWGTIKSELYRDVLETIHRDIRPPNPLHEDAAAKARL